MDQEPQFQSWFHEELDALDRFFAKGARSNDLSMGTEDPDVRRIVEAMAYFGARARAAASASMRAAIVRLAGGLLDDLFAPMPAVAMLQADGRELLDKPADLPGGTRFRVETSDGRASLFVTRAPLSVRPIIVDKAEIVRLTRGAELRLRLVAAVPQKGPIVLPLFVRRYGDYRAAVELHEALARCFQRAVARKEDGVDRPCSVAFRTPAPSAPWDVGDDGSPIGRVRSFFHAPEQDLFLHVGVPAEGGAWKSVDITLVLGVDLPEELCASRDTFLPFVVPAENAWTDLAQPITVDGTAEITPLHIAQTAFYGVEPMLVRGVYRALGGALSPLPPRSLCDEDASYEVLFPAEGPPRVRISSWGDAVTDPWKAQVDAVWSQPSLWRSARGPLSVKAQRKKLEGVTFQVMGNVRPPASSPLALSPEKGLDVLGLRQKPSLDRRDLRALLEVFGASGASPFARLPARIVDVAARYAPDPMSSRGPRKRVYRVEMDPTPVDERPLVPAFQRSVAALLDAWCPEAVEVENAAPTAGGEELLR